VVYRAAAAEREGAHEVKWKCVRGCDWTATTKQILEKAPAVARAAVWRAGPIRFMLC
jgi:hypothetical protein